MNTSTNPAIAHSAQPKEGIPEQSYANHISNVVSNTTSKCEDMLKYHIAGARFLSSAKAASEFHDLGKLEPENQEILQGRKKGKLINHVDAGVAHLVANGLWEAAIAVNAHHWGLPDLVEEEEKGRRNACLRDETIFEHTNRSMEDLIKRHGENGFSVSLQPGNNPHLSGLERRLLLSCLVDADHSDTGHNYPQYFPPQVPECGWEERLAALNAYVNGLPKGSKSDKLRREIADACRRAELVPLSTLDSAVGTGKTLSAMAYLLRLAIRFNLRHIFVVLPYCNIIRQSVKEYRKALTLPGEDPKSVVAEHHHLIEFEPVQQRHLTTLWNAPIIVTTAVQFFETLTAAKTSRLRKLHELPGSAVFIDEAHAAMPVKLWPFMFDQMRELAEAWSCKFVLGSGSLTKFWESQRIMGEGVALPDIPDLVPNEIRRESAEAEKERTVLRTKKQAMSLDDLTQWLMGFNGARLVVMNTLKNAAKLAQALRAQGVQALHVSTALAPADREKVLEQVEKRLNNDRNFVLVGTSCIEAGWNVSFDVGFRERSSLVSLEQIRGRVKRHGGDGPPAEVWDFKADEDDDSFSLNPEFANSSVVLGSMFEDGSFEQGMHAADLVFRALEEEWKLQPKDAWVATIREVEKSGCYNSRNPEKIFTVSRMARLITQETLTVVTDPVLAKKMKDGKQVTPQEVQRHSVQIWEQKFEKLHLEKKLALIADDVYEWTLGYDPDFLGVMEGLLPLI